MATPNPHGEHGELENDPASFPRDISQYSLTIGEASSLMHSQRCKFASNRKVQRMCREGAVDCYKLQTTRNGQPVSEWLVSEVSLRQHIEKNEVKWDQGVVIPPYASGNASRPPFLFGDANGSGRNRNIGFPAPDAVAMPDYSGDADGGPETLIKGQAQRNAVATPDDNGDASDSLFGETRSLASQLIENARLTAELEGTRQLIAEIREDKAFLRDELREARAGRKDVTAIAQRMLETLETIAIGGRLSSTLRNANDNVPPVATRHLDASGSQYSGDNPVRQANQDAV